MHSTSDDNSFALKVCNLSETSEFYCLTGFFVVSALRSTTLLRSFFAPDKLCSRFKVPVLTSQHSTLHILKDFVLTTTTWKCVDKRSVCNRLLLNHDICLLFRKSSFLTLFQRLGSVKFRIPILLYYDSKEFGPLFRYVLPTEIVAQP